MDRINVAKSHDQYSLSVVKGLLNKLLCKYIQYKHIRMLLISLSYSDFGVYTYTSFPESALHVIAYLVWLQSGQYRLDGKSFVNN